MNNLFRLATAVAGAALLAACAPDAWQNVRAKEFNAYLDTVVANCQPLWVGGTLYRRLDSSEGPAGQYDQLLDQMSRLFYQRISPAEFRASMLVMPGDSRSAASVDCMVAQLPTDRPKSPTGQW